MKRVTEQSLLEQPKISDIDIVRRKELLGFTQAEATLLAKCRPFIENEIDAIVAKFYEAQTSVDEIVLRIGDADTLRRLHQSQRKYVLDLFSGYYDLEYVNNRLRIGVVHKRIGVEPKLYLSAMKSLKDILSRVITGQLKDNAVRLSTRDALDKLLYFDTTLVFDTYILSMVTEVELGKLKTEEYARVLEEKVAERTRQLEELSRMEALTGLYNQKALREFLRRETFSAQRNAQPLSLVYFDVDKFKQVNDTEGHHAGDEILKTVGIVLHKISRSIDLPCRYGDDEFCIILPGSTAESAEHVCRRLIEQFAGLENRVTLSIGIAQTGPKEFDDPEDLIRRADTKMYEAKKVEGSQVRR